MANIVMYNVFPVAFTVVNPFSFFLVIIYGLWKERSEYPLWQMMPLLFVVTAYTYHWVPHLTSAILRMLTKSRPTWVKPPRSNEL